MKPFNHFFLVISVCALVFISGCFNEKKSLMKNTINIPVFINPEITMAPLMTDADAISNLADELNMPWSFKVSVEQYVEQIVTKKTREVGSCHSILAAYNDGFEAMVYSEHNTYIAIVKRCKAITIAIKMTPSNISYLNASLDKAAISELPTAIALITSTNERVSILADASLTTLNEVTPITGFAQVNDYKFKVQAIDGSQIMTILAKGDTNGDKIEDLLMLVRGAVEGGSYRATHLFVLSKQEKDGNWLLLAEY